MSRTNARFDRIRWAACLLAGTAAIGVVAAQEPAAAQAPEAAPAEPSVAELVQAGKRPDAILMYTGDVIGYLEDCGCKRNPAGGLTRRAWVVAQLQERFAEVPILLLDSGNFSDNPTPEGDRRTQTLLQAMDRLGYRVVNVGERDIRMGYAEFHTRTAGAPFHFVSANIVRRDTGEPVFEPYTVVELGEGQGRIRVGVTGAVRYNPIFLKAGPDDTELVIDQPVERVRGAVKELRAQGVDVVVVLTALNKNDAVTIAEQVPGIDYVYGAFGGLFEQAKQGDTWIYYVGNRGQRVLETRLFAKGKGKSRTFEDFTRMHFLTMTYPEDEGMRAFLNEQAAAETDAGESAAASASGAGPGAR